MTRDEAYQILGVRQEEDRKQIKKKYHQLIAKVHPDTEIHRTMAQGIQLQNRETSCKYNAQEINAAYSFLMKTDAALENEVWKKEASFYKRQEKQVVWKVPVNPQAYVEREIFQYAEDAEGNKIGIFSLTRGKYMWSMDGEDFALFLKSLLQCARQLLDEAEEKGFQLRKERQWYLGELVYLLAQQWIDVQECLDAFAKIEKIDKDGKVISFLPAMLETGWESSKMRKLKPGDALLPGRMEKHRLYLNDTDGIERGYLSFEQDELYYVILPLFEKKKVQIKMQAAERNKNGRRSQRKNYIYLDLWLRFQEKDIQLNRAETAELCEKIKRLVSGR